MTKLVTKSRGYVAFSTFLILSVVILLVSSTLALLSIFQAQQTLAREKGAAAHALAEGCAQDALLWAFLDENYAGGAENPPEGACVITVSKVGNNWVLTSTGTIDGRYTKRVRVNILREGEVTILSWKEIE
ncbi:hypothetical protein A2797_02010 [candidate division WWE3 bacterium RIFCSPHIGHO2_01_FULL_48_15]|uniref:Type 4 fimbrial biogenesis protein PilX N-terminal domain-containing protein n=1 Tax=candidate division WWE3 bacterium RIFCSPHIGHO2_01_FULL_48_15 TaxID=1802619 RepID=A0A1F4VG99_UNCKA|nr:MAG: hypothetical protein A2797_02010 [candidate division WWE3 bacterium RIFCSPHIGHO2_01_FULL_48_15]